MSITKYGFPVANPYMEPNTMTPKAIIGTNQSFQAPDFELELESPLPLLFTTGVDGGVGALEGMTNPPGKPVELLFPLANIVTNGKMLIDKFLLIP
jgi:hypothetical protein